MYQRRKSKGYMKTHTTNVSQKVIIYYIYKLLLTGEALHLCDRKQ